MNRRDALRAMGAGFGTLGLINVLHAEARRGTACSEGSSLCAESETCHFPVSERRNVAHRHVRPEADADKARRRADARSEDSDGSRVGQPDAITVRV